MGRLKLKATVQGQYSRYFAITSLKSLRLQQRSECLSRRKYTANGSPRIDLSRVNVMSRHFRHVAIFVGPQLTAGMLVYIRDSLRCERCRGGGLQSFPINIRTYSYSNR